MGRGVAGVGLMLAVGWVGLWGEGIGEGVKVGLLLPPGESEQRSVRRGVELAVARQKAAGVAVELVVRGRSGQWGVEGEEAAQLALDDGAGGLIAPAGGASAHLVLQVAGRTAVPVVSLCGDSSVTGAGIPWLRQVVPGTRAEAGALFRHYVKEGGGGTRRWAAVVPMGRGGREAAKDLRFAAAGEGVGLGTVVEDVEAGAGLGGVGNERLGARVAGVGREAVEAVLAGGLEGMLVWLEPGRAGGWVRALREAGYRGVVAGPGWLKSPVFWSIAGGESWGVSVAVPARDAASETLSKELGFGPGAGGGGYTDWMAAMAFDAVVVLVGGLRRGDVLGEAGWPGREGLVGVTGRLVFKEDGSRAAAMVVEGAGGIR